MSGVFSGNKKLPAKLGVMVVDGGRLLFRWFGTRRGVFFSLFSLRLPCAWLVCLDSVCERHPSLLWRRMVSLPTLCVSVLAILVSAPPPFCHRHCFRGRLHRSGELSRAHYRVDNSATPRGCRPGATMTREVQDWRRQQSKLPA